MYFPKLIGTVVLLAAAAVDLIAADWPQFRGPRRDGVSAETGLLQRWPGSGPPRLWTSTNLGRGYAAPIVVGERIYLAGDVDEALRLFALDREGQPIWQATNGRAWKHPYPGARASCTFSDGRLYHLSEQGEVVLLDPGADAFEVKGSFKLVPERKSDAWTHPVISDGRLYLRYQETLFCYDVRAK